MFDLFKIDYKELDSKINKLSIEIDSAQPILGVSSKGDWDKVFELCKEVNENFKKVHYPSKNERDVAWQKFFNLQNKAYKIRNDHVYSRSEKHYDELMSRLKSVDYSKFTDAVFEIITFGLEKTTVSEMKVNGKKLGEIGVYFKTIKHEMTREHKNAVHERMIEVRQNHDGFWERYKSYQSEKSKLYEEKQRAWQDKQEKGQQIKARIESNLESNTHKLYKAKDALGRFERQKDELRNKIYDSHNQNWKSKAEGWLDELNDKIRNIEDQIERVEKWIEEDKEKLRNWR